jgi:hypothetical protein
MYFYTKATEIKLQELLGKEIKRVFEIFFGVVARLRPRQQYSDARLALQKISGAIIFRKSRLELRKRKRERRWENIVSRIIANIRAGILLNVRREVCSCRIGYFIKRRVQQVDYNQKLVFMRKILLFLRRKIEQIRYINEYNIYKNSREAELNELRCDLLNEKKTALNELKAHLLNEKQAELNKLKDDLLEEKESALKELEARLLKEKESDLQKYRESLSQEQNRLEEQKWLLLQQIETEFTTAKESEIKKIYENEFNEYKHIIGEKMVQLQIENMELKEENVRLINTIKAKKMSFFDKFFPNNE